MGRWGVLLHIWYNIPLINSEIFFFFKLSKNAHVTLLPWWTVETKSKMTFWFLKNHNNFIFSQINEMKFFKDISLTISSLLCEFEGSKGFIYSRKNKKVDFIDILLSYQFSGLAQWKLIFYEYKRQLFFVYRKKCLKKSHIDSNNSCKPYTKIAWATYNSIIISNMGKFSENLLKKYLGINFRFLCDGSYEHRVFIS